MLLNYRELYCTGLPCNTTRKFHADPSVAVGIDFQVVLVKIVCSYCNAVRGLKVRLDEFKQMKEKDNAGTK